MAERYPTPPTHLETVVNEINETFDSLILQVNNRRQALLVEVRALSEEMTARETQMKRQAEDLTAMQASIQVKLRHNEMRDAQELMLAEVNQQLDRLDMAKENECLSFEYSEEKIKEAIHSFGSIVKRKGIIPNYSNMNQPIIAIGKCTVYMNNIMIEEVMNPYGVAFCEESKQIFITDWDSCIQIFTEDGMFMKRLGKGTLMSPWGVAVYRNNLYVADFDLEGIILYKLPECTLVKSVTSLSIGLLKGKYQFSNPLSLTASSNGDVFIADTGNNIIVVTNGNLVYKHQLTHTIIRKPIDIKIHDDTLFILCYATDPAIQVFNMKGDYLYSVIARKQVEECRFFCMDIIGNIIMSDEKEHNVKVFDKKGSLMHVIGKKGYNKGEFYNPAGIAVTNTGKLITVHRNSNSGLQLFK